MLIPADIGALLNFFSFTAWLFYGAVALALLILRYKWRDVHRPFKVRLSRKKTCRVLRPHFAIGILY